MNRPINLLLLGAVLLGMARCTRDTPMAGGASDIEVSARIVDSLGTPAAHATVRLRRADYVSPVPSLSKTAAFTATNTNTDSDGRFTIRGPEPGAYRIEITDSVSSAVLLACTLADDAREDLGVDTLRPFAVIAGRVDTTGSAGKQLYVQVHGLERLVTVEPDGSFAVTDLPAGTYDLRSVGADTVVAGVSGVTVDPGQRTSVSMLPGRQFSKRLYLNTTATGADVAENVYAFPLLVRLASDTLSNPGSIPFDFGQARDSGQDLRFTKPDGTQLSYEIEQWDSAGGEAAVWVRVDTVFGNNDAQYLLMHWGALSTSAPVSLSDGAAVFDTANGFAAVYHFQSAAPLRDATYNANHFRSDLTRAASGAVGDARYFDGADSMAAPDDPTLEPSSPTVSCWFRTAGKQNVVAKIINKGQTSIPFMSYTLELRNNPAVVGFQTAKIDSQYHTLESAQTITDRSWIYICGLFNETTGIGRFFVNGMLNGEFSDPVPIEYYNAGNYPLYAGCQRGGVATFYKGWLDEVRVENRPRSEGWVRLCYENQRIGSAMVRIR